MPSQRHEVIVELLRRSPDLILQLFARVSDSVDSSYRAEVHSESFSNVKASPHAADLVLKVMEGETLQQGVIAEVQLDVDSGKLFSWPLYGVGLRAELQCETCVLVITPYQRVARWAEQPIPLGAGSIFQPVVLGPDAIPALTDVEQARQWPGLAFLSALAHATDPPETAAKVAFNAVDAARQLDHRLFIACYDILCATLDGAALAQLETLMQLDVNQLQSETVRRNVALGEINAVLTILETRGIAVSSEQKQRIQQCSDLETASRWVRQAVTLSSVDELFDE